MNDSIDEPGATNPGSGALEVQEALEASSGAELTVETLDTIAAGGNMTVNELRLSQTLAMERHLRKTKEENNQNLTSGGEFRSQCENYPRSGVQGVSGA